jgi:hypothetical protein
MMRVEVRLTNQNPRKADFLTSLYIADAYKGLCIALISAFKR